MLCAMCSVLHSGHSTAAAAVAGSRTSAWFSTLPFGSLDNDGKVQGQGTSGSRKDEDRASEGQDASGLTPGAFGGPTAGTDEVSGPGPHKEMGEAEGGTTGGVASAWRGMSSSFSVGADDMAGSAAAGTVEDDVGMKVNPDDELPPGPAEMTGAAAEARAGGFGQQRDPQAQADKRAPEDLAQRARDITSAGPQEDATVSGPKGV